MSAAQQQPQPEEHHRHTRKQILKPEEEILSWSSLTDRELDLNKTATQLITDELAQQLSLYKVLRQEEQTLRSKVHYYERLAAKHGFLNRPFSIQALLDDEKAKLAKVQQELKKLIGELRNLQNIPHSEQTEITIDRLEQLISEIKAKREQETLYKQNLYHLEEDRAKYGGEIRLNITNELTDTKNMLEKISVQLANLRMELKHDWKLELDRISNLESMSNEEIWNHAYQLIIKTQQGKSGESKELLIW